MANDRHVVQRVVETERKTHHQQGGANLDLIQSAEQMLRREGAEHRRFGERRAFDLDRGDVDFSCRIKTLAPEALAVAVKRNREPGGPGHVGRVDMQFDLDPVGEMLARLVDHHMPAGHQKQALIPLEEKPARIRHGLLPVESADARGRQQNGFDHSGTRGLW